MSNHATSSYQASKRRTRSTPQSRRSWTLEEERTLIDGLKELCAKGWKADNGTFRPGYTVELECYLQKTHPNCGLKSAPHINSKLKAWKRDYGTIFSLKSQSGLGFQYSEGRIIVDDPNKWNESRLIQMPKECKTRCGQCMRIRKKYLEKIEQQERLQKGHQMLLRKLKGPKVGEFLMT